MYRKKTVVIADADEKFLKELELELTKGEVYQVLGTAGDGEMAVQLVEELRPDILITDLLLPQCDGLSVMGSVYLTRSR